MRLLRLIALLYLAGSFAASFAQTTQSQSPANPPPPSQGSAEQQTPATPQSPSSQQGQVLPPASAPLAAPPAKPFRVILVPGKKKTPKQLRDGPLDPAIYLRKEARISARPDRLN